MSTSPVEDLMMTSSSSNNLPPQAPSPPKTCAKCGREENSSSSSLEPKLALIPCPNCQSVYYCPPSIRSCQQAHFPIHQEECMLNASQRNLSASMMRRQNNNTNNNTITRRTGRRSFSGSPRARSNSRSRSAAAARRRSGSVSSNDDDGATNEDSGLLPELVELKHSNSNVKKKEGIEISTQTNEVVEVGEDEKSETVASKKENFHQFADNTNDDDDDEPPPLDPAKDGKIHEFPVIEKKQYSKEEDEKYTEKLNYFNKVEDEKEINVLLTDEKLQRSMIHERARMERQDFENTFEKDLVETRELLIEAVRSKLRQQSTFTTYYQGDTNTPSSSSSSSSVDVGTLRQRAKDELAKLDELVKGMQGYVIEPREVDHQLVKAREVLLQGFQKEINKKFKELKGEAVVDHQEVDHKSEKVTTLPAKSAEASLFPASQNVAMNGLTELSLKHRCKLVVEIKDLCDKLKRMKMNALGSPQRWNSIEELYAEGVEVANRVPVAGTLTLMATKAELERYLRIHTTPTSPIFQ